MALPFFIFYDNDYGLKDCTNLQNEKNNISGSNY